MNERTLEVPSPINIVASSVDEMSSLPSVGQQSCWVLPDARLVFALVVSILDNSDEPVPLPLEPRTLKFLELAVEFDQLQRSYQAGLPTPSPWPQPIPLAATISGVNAALGSMRMGLYTMPDGILHLEVLDPRCRESCGQAVGNAALSHFYSRCCLTLLPRQAWRPYYRGSAWRRP